MLETHTISKIDVLEGKSELNLEGLSDIILGLENFKSFDLAGDTSKCPDLPIINDIINEISNSFYNTIMFLCSSFPDISINFLSCLPVLYSLNIYIF
mgnify:CR=1 FL=1